MTGLFDDKYTVLSPARWFDILELHQLWTSIIWDTFFQTNRPQTKELYLKQVGQPTTRCGGPHVQITEVTFVVESLVWLHSPLPSTENFQLIAVKFLAQSCCMECSFIVSFNMFIDLYAFESLKVKYVKQIKQIKQAKRDDYSGPISSYQKECVVAEWFLIRQFHISLSFIRLSRAFLVQFDKIVCTTARFNQLHIWSVCLILMFYWYFPSLFSINFQMTESSLS